MDTRMPQDPAPSPGRRAQRGSVILYLIVALVAFGVLALAGATRFGSTVGSVLLPNCATSARLMAESGVRYALARLRACTTAAAANTAVAAMNGATFTVDAAKGLSFTLAVSYDSATSTASITSTGTGCSIASPNITASAGTVNLPSLVVDPSKVGVSGLDGFASTGTTGAVSINTATQSALLGNSIKGAQASLRYMGNNALCTNGVCTLGNGLCAYFRLQFNPTNLSYSQPPGDGFVWAVISAATNAGNAYGGGGENNAYGGSVTVGGTTYTIRPPKLGLEFDITQNYKNCGKVCTPSGIDNIACDATSDDHLAFMFWGLQTLSCDAAKDDIVHGAGAGTSSEPYNSANFDGSRDGWDGYYSRGSGSWLWSGGGSGGYQYMLRYELDRPTTPNAEGNYVYLERAWLVKAGDTYAATLSNCTATHTAAPSLSRAFALSPDLHTKLNTVYFGWTIATGAYTEIVKLDQFSMNFKGAPATPTTPTVPSDYVAAYTFSEAQNATAHDLSSNRNHATGAGAAMWGPDVRSVSGASMFVAGSGYATVPNSASLQLTSSGSIASWFKIRNFSVGAGLVHKGVLANWSDESYSLEFAAGRTLKLYVCYDTVGGCRTVTSAAIPNNSQWYHVAATWDATNLKIYINGTLSATAPNTNSKSAQVNTSKLILGAELPTSPYYGFDGMIDDVYLYNRALTAAEIANMALGHP